MKNYLSKIVAVCFVATSMFSANAFAKTHGLTGGAAITQNSVDYKNNVLQINSVGTGAGTAGSITSDSSMGYALNLKYSFSDFLDFKGLYLAPSIFYENLNSSATDNSTTATLTAASAVVLNGTEYSLSSRHGVKVDLGYDILDNLSAYASLGVGVVSYRVDSIRTVGLAGTGGFNIVNGTTSSEIIGFGVNYEFVKNWLMNLEYNRQQLTLNSYGFDGAVGEGNISRIGTKIESMQFGLAYRF